jgi:hypothetical protein
LPVAHDSPRPRVSSSVRPCARGDTTVARSPPATSCRRCRPPRHLRSTRSPCNRRLHMRSAPLSHVTAMSRPVPLLFLGSHQAPAPLCSASHRAPLLQAPSADYRAPPSCASEPRQAAHNPEPPSFVGNRRSTEPATFFFTC